MGGQEPTKPTDEAPHSPVSLHQWTQVTRVSDFIYAAHLHPDLCVGSVPNGGYVASVLLQTAKTHLGQLSSSSKDHVDPFQVHVQYLDRTRAGPAHVFVHQAKLGRNSSVLHLSVHQDDALDGSASRPRVAAYMTCGNLVRESGLTIPVSWRLWPAAPTAPVDFGRLRNGLDAIWSRSLPAVVQRTRSMHVLEYYAPRAGHSSPSVHDYWLCCADGSRMTDVTLGFVADAAAPLLVEYYFSLMAKKQQQQQQQQQLRHWYPTVSMSLDVKQKLPSEGVEWLRMRAESKAIRNGRSDMEVILFDEQGRLVALSHHVAMVLDFSRNVKDRMGPRERI